MDLGAALRAGPALLRRRPAAVLPYYLLAASVPTVARAPLVLAGGAAVAWLAATGRLEAVAAALRGTDLDLGSGAGAGPGPSGGLRSGLGGGAGGPALPPDLVEALSGLVTPTTVALVGAGLAATLPCLLVARAVTAAGALSAVERGLAGDDPLPGGARGMARRWRPFLGLVVVRAGARIAAVGAAALAVGAAVAGVGAGGALAVAGVLAGVVGAAAALLVAVAVELVVAFAGAAVVVDDRGAVGALRRATGLAVERPGALLGYLAAGAAALAGVGAAAAVLAVAGAPRVVGVGTALLVAPALDGLRVALYAERGPGALPEPDASLRRRARDALRNGLAGLGRFVRRHPVANAGSAGLLVAGAALGWLAVAPYRLSLSPPGGREVGAVFGAVPIGPFLNIAANNWLVAAGTGYGGLALGLPAATALLLNGALVGVVAGTVDPTVGLALVAPHGVVELPAIAVGGGLGLHLGRIGAEALRGRRDAAQVGAALGEALWVLVGLGAVLVVASAVETVITPRIAAAVLG